MIKFKSSTVQGFNVRQSGAAKRLWLKTFDVLSTNLPIGFSSLNARKRSGVERLNG